ncbi:hypothetical protein GCM10010277_87890 [Streptomyces longisporoflavus]|uniref:hypothetical protein n=1 Tax=Streptomyces longisporoflavus TaxID=28044 RepID=UPI001983ABBF|nr:hypothetical protein GCM10010277_87890 [Streptomyces longisporoflavus]
MTSNNTPGDASSEVAVPPSVKAVDDQLIEELVGRAQAEGLQLAGEGGLLQQLTKRLLESALEGEVTDHLGYDRHDPAGKEGAGAGPGHTRRTVERDYRLPIYVWLHRTVNSADTSAS